MVTSGPVVVVTVVCDGDVCAVLVPVGVVVSVPVTVFVSDTVDEGGLESDESAVLVVFEVSASPVDVVDVSEVVDESPSGVAHATPGEVATAVPMPSATASAPTRPMYIAYRVRVNRYAALMFWAG
ncbi:MAG TPA: hypothetical protein VJ777_25300, partial [Mycobacterium sp.]|nr:hypothetical protein [Mycobacterium sp.]